MHFNIYVDIDPDYNRTGVDIDSQESIDLVKSIVQSEYLIFEGLYVHGGNSYHSHNQNEIKQFAIQERDVILKFAQLIRDEGIEVKQLAIGATPTSQLEPESLPGITEMHPGNYVFFDTFQSTIGSCNLDDCSSVILTRIISKYKGSKPRLLIDAGAFALSKDLGPTHVNNYKSFGLIEDHPELKIEGISQEVGVVVSSDDTKVIDVDKYNIGMLLRIIPNHSCLSTYCYEKVFVVEGDYVIDEWKTCPRHSVD